LESELSKQNEFPSTSHVLTEILHCSWTWVEYSFLQRNLKYSDSTAH